MPVIATDTLRFSNLVKYEFHPAVEHCRDAVVANEAAITTYAVGTLLAKSTLTGKYQVCISGSVTVGAPAAVVLDDYTLPAVGDTTVKVLNRGPAGISKGALVLDASFNTQAKKDAAYAALEALGIKVLDTV